jgi:hypothetical protein
MIDSSAIGTAPIGAGGVATFSLNLVESAVLAAAHLGGGWHIATAVYNGDAACYGPTSRSRDRRPGPPIRW